MNIGQVSTTITRLLFILVLFATPLSAQRRRQPAPKPQPPVQPAQAAPTFDTLIAADSYKIYAEARGVGQLIRSPGVNDLLDPVMKLSGPPKEFKTLVKWLNAHADALMTSRMMFAAWPSRQGIPQVLFAIEFPSAEEAKKFEPQLNEFLPKFLPTPRPEAGSAAPGSAGVSPAVTPQPRQRTAEAGSAGVSPAVTANPRETTPPPQYTLKQSGSLVVISDTKFTFKNLRPAGSKALAEDQNFRVIHDRFSSDSLFLYFDINSIEKEQQERIKKMEEESKRLESEIANSGKAEEENESATHFEVTTSLKPGELPPDSPEPPQVVSQAQPQAVLGTGGVSEESSRVMPNQPDPMTMAFASLSRAFFGGRPKWPEAIGVAFVFDSESYVMRALLVNSPDVKGNAIPFIPALVSGPSLLPESPSVLPGDTELFVATSLDFPGMYEGILTTLKGESHGFSEHGIQTIKTSEPESPFAAYEKKLGLKIKDDLLPLLGSEVAFSVPVKTLNMGPPAQTAKPAPSSAQEKEATDAAQEPPASSSMPVVAISVKDKEALRTLLPKMIDSLSVKGASLLANTEKRGDTELVSYANIVSYAFVGNFLVVSPDTNAVRHVVDSYLNNSTLASDINFKNNTRWQPRQVLAQVYVSPALMENYNSVTRDVNSPGNEQLRDFLSRIGPTAEPVTYAISNEGLGPLHELHVPKNLVMLMIAGISSETNQPPLARNEAIVKGMLRTIVSAEATYQATEGDGKFGTIDQLEAANLIQKDFLKNFGYRIELTVGETTYEVTAVPVEYGKTGRLSFFVDETAVIRGADRGGAPATAGDTPLQ